MVWKWEPGTQYDYGYVVEYEGVKYKIIQPHRSQGDWTPPVTPALWARMPDDHEYNEGHPPPQKKDTHDVPSYQPQGGYTAPHPNQNVDIDHEERKKNWFDIDDERKQQLEIGGGLLAGAAALGAGYFAYNHHKKSDEDKKADTWALQNWLHEAQSRTDDYYRNNGAGHPVAWVLNQGQNIPPAAIEAGEDSGNKLFVARAFQDGGIQIGKASGWFQKGAVIGYKEHEIQLETYEVLVGDSRAVRWVAASGEFNHNNLGHRPVEGGRENNGTPLYIAQAPYHGGTHPGKIADGLDGAIIPYGGKEKKVDEYRVLCYA